MTWPKCLMALLLVVMVDGTVDDCFVGCGTTYRGTAAETVNGNVCNNWLGEHHSINPDTYPGTGLGDHNYCRNPTPHWDTQPWCYADHEYCGWNYCQLDRCPETTTPQPVTTTPIPSEDPSDLDCYVGSGESYRGTKTETEHGHVCLNWSNFVNPEAHPGKGLGDHNYCRNPDGDVKPWCFVYSNYGDWDYCDLDLCPIDCAFEWEETVPCSVSCGGGEITEVLHIISPEENGGEACPGQEGDTRTRPCNVDPCPAPPCETLERPCENNGFCVDAPDDPFGYFCICPPFSGGQFCQFPLCIFNFCDNGALCILEGFFFECLCTPGFKGLFCQSDINECTEDANDCDLNANCVNNVGSFTCSCASGYSGDGKSCTDINECENGLAECDPNADCFNTDGGFACVCKQGYTGDGQSCVEICPEGFSLYVDENGNNGNCYKYIWEFETFDNAQHNCQTYGTDGNLAKIHTKALKDWVLEEFGLLQSRYDFWVGLKETSGISAPEFRWEIDGSVLSNDDAVWIGLEPNHPYEGACAKLKYDRDARRFGLADYNCYVCFPFICETPDTGSGCAHLVNGKCYSKFYDYMDYYSAREVCIGYNGNLVQADTQQLINWLQHEFDLYRDDEVWVGLKDQTGRRYTWISDGSEYEYMGDNRGELWEYGKPDGGLGECVRFKYDHHMHDFFLNDFPCKNEYDYLCEVPGQ